MIAAITAGGRVDGALAAAIGTDVKALAPLGGERLVDRSIAAARAAGASRVVVIGGAEIRAHCAGRVEKIVSEAAEGRENLRLAIEAAGGEPLLFLTSDLPFVTGDAAHAFVDRALGSDLALPLATEEDYLRAYPGAPPHITRVGNERVAGGSVVYFGPGVGSQVLAISQRLFDARKSLLRMATLLGPALLLRFVAKRLEIEHIEQRAVRVFGINARAVRNAAPNLCFDVDTLEDYEYAVARLARS
jgi:GTP:adenosylcobinamide-phosphate guanylyltransferase